MYYQQYRRGDCAGISGAGVGKTLCDEIQRGFQMGTRRLAQALAQFESLAAQRQDKGRRWLAEQLVIDVQNGTR